LCLGFMVWDLVVVELEGGRGVGRVGGHYSKTIFGNRELSISSLSPSSIGMKTDRIRTDIINIIFVFIFLVEFGFEYG